VQELPLDQKLMLLSLQYPAVAREVVQSVLHGEGGCLEAATATLEFYDREVRLLLNLDLSPPHAPQHWLA